jgi:hypothetical protein
MAEISTAMRDDDPDDAARQYPSTVMNKYHCEITQELAGDDDAQSGVVGSQTIEKMGTGPLPKESECPPKNNHAHEESGTTTKYPRIAKKNLVGDKDSKEMDNKRKDDDYDNDHSGVGDGQEDDWSDDDLSDTKEIDPEDEEFDNPNDSQIQAEKQSTTTTPWSIFQLCSWLLKSPSEN